LSVRRSDKHFRRGLTGRAIVAILLAGGCTTYERAEIEVSLGRPVARGPEGALLLPVRPAGTGPDDVADGVADFKLTLTASGSTSRAELGLLTSALEFVGAHGRARSIVDGLAHFSGGATRPRMIIRIDHVDPCEDETWLLDRNWALRKLGCGAVLAWEGDLGPVLDRLSVILRGRGRF